MSNQCKKIISLVLAGVLFAGSFVLPPKEAAAQTKSVTGLGADIKNMFTTDVNVVDNTWLFAGGIETQGRFAEIGGARNFVGQFEEYIRYQQAKGSDIERQRHVINVGKAGQDIVAFEEKLDAYIDELDPKAVAYLIGREDYGKGADGVAAFKTALTSVVDKALSMKNHKGFAVVQTPHAVADEATDSVIQLYVTAAEEVLADVASNDKGHVVLVDHYASTNTNDFKTKKLTADGLLNADGHFELAKQLAQATYGSSANFQTFTAWTANPEPEVYLHEMPEVTAHRDSLRVAMPQDAEGTSWSYRLSIKDMGIDGTAEGAQFVIDRLPEGAQYELVVRSADGKSQYDTVAGTVAEGAKGARPELSRLQQAIADKVNGSKPLTWLFMGDSITHACIYTYGYDGIAQIIEKYVKEDLGRVDDVVINTGNSSATTTTTLNNIEQRLTKYKPDIVAVMLGTNDITGTDTSIDVEQYKQNMQTIVEKIREANPEAAIIFRSPTPANGGVYNQNLQGANNFLDAMRSVAEKDGKILFIDQFTDWVKEAQIYPYLYKNTYHFGNFLHPGAAGHLRMAQQFIEECGLNENGRIPSLSYQFPDNVSESSIVPKVITARNAVMVSRSALQEKYGTADTIGAIEVMLTDQETQRIYTQQTGLDGKDFIMSGIPTDAAYTVQVTARIAGSEPKYVRFAPAEVTLRADQRIDFHVVLSRNSDGSYVEDLKAGDVVGICSVDGFAPNGIYKYSLVSGENFGDNGLFELEQNVLKVKTGLEKGRTYRIRIKADSGDYRTEDTFVLKTVPTLSSARLAAARTFAAEKKSLDVDLADVSFDGATSINLMDASDEHAYSGAYKNVLEKLRTESVGGTIIIRFSTSQQGVLFGVGSSYADDGTNIVFVATRDGIRTLFRAPSTGTKGTLKEEEANYLDGETHTMAVSLDSSNTDASKHIVASIDGSENLVPTAWWTGNNKSWFHLSSGGEISKFEVGGGGYATIEKDYGNFNGSIEFLTITDEIYDIKGLQEITKKGAENPPLPELSVIEGEQSLRLDMDGYAVEAPEGAHYGATDLYFSQDGLTAEFTLFPEGDTVFDSDAVLKISNLEQAGFKSFTYEISAESVAVTLTIEPLKFLDNETKKYDAFTKNHSEYTEQSYQAFLDAYQAAKDAVAGGESDGGALMALLERLRSAADGLQKLPSGQKPKPQTKPGQTVTKLAAPDIRSLKSVAQKKLMGVKITVEKVANATAYSIYRIVGSREEFLGRAGADGVFYDQNPPAKKKLSYRAAAESTNVSFALSDKGSAKTIQLSSSVKKIRAKQAGKGAVRISWKKVKGAKQYVIYRSEKAASGYARIKVVKKGTASSFVDRKVKPGRRYYYRIVTKIKKQFSAPKTSGAVKVKKSL